VAFPTTSVQKTFPQSDGLLTSQDSDFSALGGATTSSIVSNTVVNGTAAYVGNYLDTPADQGTDMECYIDCVDSGAYFGVFARLTTPAGSYDGYQASWATPTVTAQRLDNGVQTQIGSSASVTLATGDALGVEVIGSAIKVYTRQSGTWTERVSTTDATYSAAGTVAFDMFQGGSFIGLDNMGYGPAVAAGTSLPRRSRRAYAGLTMRGAR
jgi:hypothetical protein